MTDVKQTAERISTEALEVADALDEFSMIDGAEGGNPLVIATEQRAAELLRILASRHADAQEGGKVGNWFDLAGDARLGACATDGCGGQPTSRLEVDGVGSDYCSGCAAKIRALNPRKETVEAPDTKNTVSDNDQIAALASAIKQDCLHGSRVWNLADQIETLLIDQSLRASIPGGVGKDD